MNTDTNQELTVSSVMGTALEGYAERTVVRELVQRMMSFHPAADEVGEKGMLMAAQLAILMNASPIPGTNEIHIWVDKKGITHVAPGINYWTRRAQQAGGIFWITEPRPMTEQEKEFYQIPAGIMAAICKGVKKSNLYSMLRAGFTKKEIYDGDSFTGIGSTTTGDYAKNGRPLIWNAIKRCRTDFYKQAIPYVPGEQAPAADGLTRDDHGNLIPNMHRMNYEAMQPQPDLRELTDEQAESANSALFGMAEGETPVRGDSGGSSVELEPVEAVIIDATHPLTIIDEITDAPTPEEWDLLLQWRAEKEAKTAQKPEPEPDRDPGETAVYEKGTRSFWKLVIEHIAWFDDVEDAKKSAGLLGFNRVPADAAVRVDFYRDLRKFALDRGAGVAVETAVDHAKERAEKRNTARAAEQKELDDNKLAF